MPQLPNGFWRHAEDIRAAQLRHALAWDEFILDTDRSPFKRHIEAGDEMELFACIEQLSEWDVSSPTPGQRSAIFDVMEVMELRPWIYRVRLCLID